jgi:hypothetical protein
MIFGEDSLPGTGSEFELQVHRHESLWLPRTPGPALLHGPGPGPGGTQRPIRASHASDRTLELSLPVR